MPRPTLATQTTAELLLEAFSFGRVPISGERANPREVQARVLEAEGLFLRSRAGGPRPLFWSLTERGYELILSGGLREPVRSLVRAIADGHQYRNRLLRASPLVSSPLVLHRLKALPEYFSAALSGEKLFEVRSAADRSFATGEVALLEEWSDPHGYTGRRLCLAIGRVFVLPSAVGPDLVAFNTLPISPVFSEPGE